MSRDECVHPAVRLQFPPMSVQNQRIYAVIDTSWSHGAVINGSSEELSVEYDASNVDVGETHMFNLAAQKLVSNFPRSVYEF